MSSTAASAPGKVLLAGGYLVVDRQYTGLVLGLNARIHVHVQSTLNKFTREILVRSPQFIGSAWRYKYRVIDQDGGVELIQVEDASNVANSRNKFVEIALAYALSYITCYGADRIESAVVTILADSSYYSQSQTSTACSTNSGSPFKNFNVPLSEAHKTGLGSSAALVTAFITAILSYYLPSAPIAADRLHNLAQVAHCVAQGKIGSGFDVAAAVYGSCIYRRFTPEILENIGAIGDANFSNKLRSNIEDQDLTKWDTQIAQSMFALPPGLRLVMCDVDCGSETPSMVKQVMAWRRDSPEECLLLWKTLAQSNNDLAAEFRKLSEKHYTSWDDLRNLLSTIRSLLREMSIKAGVPIEPPMQTHLLDACSQVVGVVGGVVPGAGGYDALALIVEDRDEVIEALKAFLLTYRSPAATDVKVGKIQLLDTKQEAQGLRMEPVELYSGWLQVSG